MIYDIRIRKIKNKRNQKFRGNYTYWLYQMENGVKTTHTYINAYNELDRELIKELIKKAFNKYGVSDVMIVYRQVLENTRNEVGVVNDNNELKTIIKSLEKPEIELQFDLNGNTYYKYTDGNTYRYDGWSLYKISNDIFTQKQAEKGKGGNWKWED